jgi:hypothetical protein
MSHELPKVVPLPPIDLSSSMAVNQDLLLAIDRDSNLPKSPSPSYAESFATAYTSHPDDDQLSPRPFLAPPSSLRKSLSVDSFVNVGMSDTRGARPSSPRGQLSQAGGYPIPDSWSVIVGRTRGDSVSSVQEDYGTPIVDSDFERYDPNPSGDRVRNPSPQGSLLPSASSVRGGELPLPSRTQGLSAASSLSSITSASTSSSHREPHGAFRSATSLQAPVHSSRMEIGRSRSGSLGVYSPAQHKRMTINTQVRSLSPLKYLASLMLILLLQRSVYPSLRILWSLPWLARLPVGSLPSFAKGYRAIPYPIHPYLTRRTTRLSNVSMAPISFFIIPKALSRYPSGGAGPL